MRPHKDFHLSPFSRCRSERFSLPSTCAVLHLVLVLLLRRVFSFPAHKILPIPPVFVSTFPSSIYLLVFYPFSFSSTARPPTHPGTPYFPLPYDCSTLVLVNANPEKERESFFTGFNGSTSHEKSCRRI